MTQIANLLVVQCLERGYLVASVRVYGLLADYKTENCIPMVYCIDFESNTSKLLVGTKLSFANCFAAIITNCMKIDKGDKIDEKDLKTDEG